MDILIDSREKSRRERASAYYSDKGHNASIDTLDVGDYVFSDQVVFEYKEISDFIIMLWLLVMFVIILMTNGIMSITDGITGMISTLPRILAVTMVL